jgi:hypothetical protein
MTTPIRIPSTIAVHVDTSTTMPQFSFSAWLRHARARVSPPARRWSGAPPPQPVAVGVGWLPPVPPASTVLDGRRYGEYRAGRVAGRLLR